jgi:hypothetical protein
MIDNIEIIKNCEKPIKEYKTKEYVRRAKRNYEKKKNLEDPDYKKKRLESCKKSQEKNKEKYKEQKRLYMQKYRAKKKLEKLKSSDKIIEQMTTLTINTKS